MCRHPTPGRHHSRGVPHGTGPANWLRIPQLLVRTMLCFARHRCPFTRLCLDCTPSELEFETFGPFCPSALQLRSHVCPRLLRCPEHCLYSWSETRILQCCCWRIQSCRCSDCVEGRGDHRDTGVEVYRPLSQQIASSREDIHGADGWQAVVFIHPCGMCAFLSE